MRIDLRERSQLRSLSVGPVEICHADWSCAIVKTTIQLDSSNKCLKFLKASSVVMQLYCAVTVQYYCPVCIDI